MIRKRVLSYEVFPPKHGIFDKISQTGGGDQPDFICLIQNTYVLRNAVRFLNKDFIKAVDGGGVTVS